MKKLFFAIALTSLVGSMAANVYAASTGTKVELKDDDKKKKKKKKGCCSSTTTKSCTSTEKKSCCTSGKN